MSVHGAHCNSTAALVPHQAAVCVAAAQHAAQQMVALFVEARLRRSITDLARP